MDKLCTLTKSNFGFSLTRFSDLHDLNQFGFFLKSLTHLVTHIQSVTSMAALPPVTITILPPVPTPKAAEGAVAEGAVAEGAVAEGAVAEVPTAEEILRNFHKEVRGITSQEFERVLAWLVHEPREATDAVLREVMLDESFDSTNFMVWLMRIDAGEGPGEPFGFRAVDCDRKACEYVMSRIFDVSASCFDDVWMQYVADAAHTIPTNMLIEFLHVKAATFAERNPHLNLNRSQAMYRMLATEFSHNDGQSFAQTEAGWLDEVATWLFEDDHSPHITFLCALRDDGVRFPRLALRGHLMLASQVDCHPFDRSGPAAHARHIAIMCRADSLGLYPEQDPSRWRAPCDHGIPPAVGAVCSVLSDGRVRGVMTLVSEGSFSVRQGKVVRNGPVGSSVASDDEEFTCTCSDHDNVGMLVVARVHAELTRHENPDVDALMSLVESEPAGQEESEVAAQRLLVYMADMFGHVEPGSRGVILESRPAAAEGEHDLMQPAFEVIPEAGTWALWKEERLRGAWCMYSPAPAYAAILGDLKALVNTRKRARSDNDARMVAQNAINARLWQDFHACSQREKQEDYITIVVPYVLPDGQAIPLGGDLAAGL
jgi:hypothetical protein